MNILFELHMYSNCMRHKLMELKTAVLILNETGKKRECKGMKLNYSGGSTYIDER